MIAQFQVCFYPRLLFHAEKLLEERKSWQVKLKKVRAKIRSILRYISDPSPLPKEKGKSFFIVQHQDSVGQDSVHPLLYFSW